MLPACRASRCNHGDCRLITRLPGLPILMKTFIRPYELEKHVFFSYFGLLKVGMQTCLQVKVQKEGPEGRGMGGGRGGWEFRENPSAKSAGLPATTKDFEKAKGFLIRLKSEPFHACFLLVLGVGGAVASWLPCSSLDRAVRVRAPLLSFHPGE